MKRIILFSLLTLFLATQCGKNDTDNLLAIFPLNHTKVENNFENFVDKLVLIPISESKENLISDISKIIIGNNNNFLFLDGNAVVKVFSPDGKFIRDIGTKGRGPGEYINIEDICLTADGNHLLILQTGSVNKYRVSDGSFITKIEIPRKNYDAICSSINGSFYLFSSNPADDSNFETPFYALSNFSEKGKLIKELLPRKDFVFTQGIFTQSYDKSTIMRPQEGDNIAYKIRDEVVPFLKIDFQERAIPSRYIFRESNDLYSGMKNYLYSEYYKLPIYIHDTRKFIYFSSIGPGAKQNDFLFNIENCNGIHWTYEQNDNDPLFIMASDDEFFYTSIYIDTESLNFSSYSDTSFKANNLTDYLLKNICKTNDRENKLFVAKIKFKIDY